MTRTLRGLLEPGDVRLDVPANCKRSVLERLAGLAAKRHSLDAADLLERLTVREHLGSTGVGGGVAIPHIRADVGRLSGLMIRLREPVDFDAIDGKPVDLAFMLIAPEADHTSHLKTLSRVARTFRQPGVVRSLRGAGDPEAACAVLLAEAEREAAA